MRIYSFSLDFFVVLSLSLTLCPPPSLARPLRGAIHIHSKRSFDSRGEMHDIEKAARFAGLDFVILTDHAAGKKRGQAAALPTSTTSLIWIDGVELEINNRHHVLVLGSAVSQVKWEKGKEMEGVRRAREWGAVAFLNHFTKYGEFEQAEHVDGLELYNAHEDVARPIWRLPKLIFLGWTVKENPRQILLALLDAPQKAIDYWDQWSRPKPIPVIAGNDAHQKINFFGRSLDPYEHSFLFVNTYVEAPERNERAILWALKEGKSFIAFPFLEDPAGFNFHVTPSSIRIAIPQPLGGKAKIRLIHNAKLVQEEETNFLLVRQPPRGQWRCEAWISTTEGWKPWIYSNIRTVE